MRGVPVWAPPGRPTLIGGCGIHVPDLGKSVGDMGYTFSKEHWGKGYGTEAAKALVQFGFNELNLHRIWATCRPENIGSAKVLEKCGMKREGYLRQNMLQRGVWRDSILYAIIKDEFISPNTEQEIRTENKLTL